MSTHLNAPQRPWAAVPVVAKNGMQYLLLLASALSIGLLFYATRPAAVPTSDEPGRTPPPLLNGSAAAQSGSSVNDIATDAAAFYNSLNTSQRDSLLMTYTSTLARKWSNLPCGRSCRNGVQLGTNLTAAQYALAMKVVKDALGTAANEGSDEFHQMNLAEAYLHANGGGNGYDSVLRWMAFLNTPSATGAWMLQFGGHHYAANIAFNNGHVIGATPFFMGLEPKSFTYNSVTYDPLGGERDAFRSLFATLSSSQLSSAYLSSSFSDCVMIPGESSGGTATFPAAAQGIALSALTSAQQQLALSVIQLYTGDMDAATAATVQAGYANEIASTYISYHGGGSSGSASSFLTAQGDYMRISGPNVWVEFSCQGGVVIQNQIHYHTVWRDRSHDYGVNLSGASIDGTTSVYSLGVSTRPLSIYPNPAQDRVTVALPSFVSDADARIISAVSGQTVRQITHVGGSDFRCDVSGLAPGAYFIKVQQEGAVYSGKLLKQ